MALLLVFTAACGGKKKVETTPTVTETPEEPAVVFPEDDDLGADDFGGDLEEDFGTAETTDVFADDPFGTDEPITEEEDPLADLEEEDPFMDDAVPEELPPELPDIAPCELETVYFDFDDSTLRPDARSALSRVAECLKSDPGRRIRIEGHCDERGTMDYNEALGSRRAASVRRFLISQGVPRAQIDTISFGESQPAAFGHDETARTLPALMDVELESPDWREDGDTDVDVGPILWQ